MKYHVKSLKLADQGKKRILWADGDMPVLAPGAGAVRQDQAA